MRDLPIFPRPFAALLLPVLGACGGGKDGAEACESLMTALCAAGDDDTCGLGGPTADACGAWKLAAELEVPALTAEAAEACVELLEAPECDSPSWEAAVADCAQLSSACVQLPSAIGGDDWGVVDACDWPENGVCVEFEGYSGAEAWCAEQAQSSGWTSTFYGGEGCPEGGDGPCVYPAIGDFPVSVDVYYDFNDVALAAELCTSGGGVWEG